MKLGGGHYRETKRLRGRRISLAIAVAAVVANAFAAPVALARSAHVKFKLDIVRKDELRFGKMVVLAPSGEVTIPADGLVSYRNAVHAGGAVGPAVMLFEGMPNRMIDVHVTAPVMADLGRRGDVRLDKLTLEPLNGGTVKRMPGVIRIKLDSSGTNGLVIGGTLLVSPNGSSGLTSIIIPVTASYIGDQ